MKKIIALLLAVMLVFSLAACGGTAASGSSTESDINAESAAEQTKSDNDDIKADNTSTDSKTLIVYFSWSSNTDVMANYIHDKIGSDIERLEPVNAYPQDYNETADKAKAERDNDERPEFKPLQYNPEDYDTVFIGYPIWWYELPMITRTFFDTYDFSGKTIIPFNTHAGSGDGGTYEMIKELEPNAAVKEGLAIAGADIKDSDSNKKVIGWLEDLGY